MAVLTAAQWAKTQRNLPQEDRQSYASYLESVPKAKPAAAGKLPNTAYNAGTYVPSSGYVAPTPRTDGLPSTVYNQNTYVPTSGFVGTPPAGAGGGTGGGTGSGAGGTAGAQTKDERDAIAKITALLASYGIKDLAGPITDAVIKGYSADTIELIMQDPGSTDPLAVAFQKRFPANKARIAAGKPAISAAEYLRYERTYAESFKQFGVPDLGTPETFSSFIANDVSPAEVVDRVSLAVNRVNNADQATKDAIKNFYPMISQSDLVRSILNPAEGLPALQRKVQIAEIGGAAMTQGLNASLNAATPKALQYEGISRDTMGATQLAELGVTKERAQAGYENIAELLPRSEFLSSISQGEDYTQKTAEQEEFQGLASAKRARRTLAETEVGRFSGSSGVNKTSLQGSKGSF